MPWCVLLVLAAAAAVHASGGDVLSQVLEAVNRIEQQLQKEDRLREVAQLVSVDASLKSLERKLSGDRSTAPALPRTAAGSIDARLQRLEMTVEALQSGLAKVEESIVQSWDSERKRIDDLDSKLRKMSNVITALYEMNKEMKKNIRPDDRLLSSAPAAGTSEFLLENLEEMERKIKEQMSVVLAEMSRDLGTVKQVAFSILDRCEPPTHEAEQVEREDGPVRNDRRTENDAIASGALNGLMQNLSRSTREMREELRSLGQKLSADTSSPCKPSDKVSLPPPVQQVRGSDSSCSSSASHIVAPKSCAELRRGGATCNGAYIIFLQSSRAVRVYCDMTTGGGGWTVIMRRGDYGPKQISFNQNWNGYKEGFGDVEGEFWLGNDNIHFLTSQETNSLQVRLEAFDGDKLNLSYNSFLVENEDNNYRLKLGMSTSRPSAMGNTLLHHNNRNFSTYDRKNTNSTENCADRYKGGWWFNRCYYGFLTGEYFRPEERKDRWRGILWYDWKKDEPLKSAEMMIRPKDML